MRRAFVLALSAAALIPDEIARFGYRSADAGSFGLHSGANAAKEISGSLTAHSNGPGTGTGTTLDLPADGGRHGN